MKNNKGFTLIEMLVVIAVVGILSAAVLTALGPSRAKAKDTRIISALSQVRIVAETVFDGDYDLVTLTQTQIAPLNADITANGGVLVLPTIASPQYAYAAYSRLASDATRAFCVDSLGTAKTVALPSGGITVCP